MTRRMSTTLILGLIAALVSAPAAADTPEREDRPPRPWRPPPRPPWWWVLEHGGDTGADTGTDTGTDDGGATDDGEDTTTTVGDRGIWFWSSSSSAYGSVNILGDEALEDETITDFLDWGVGVIYGSYSDLPADSPEEVAAWNQKLHDEGLESQLLLSGTTWVYESDRDSFLDQIDERLLGFHDIASGDERFDALHIDLEPHILPAWSPGTDADRRELLELYLETIEEARDYLDAAGETALPIELDLPVWFDSSSSLGFTDDADRDDWWDRLMTAADGVSMMAYERDSASRIESGIDWELARYPGQIRAGVDIDIPDTWTDLDDMVDVMQELETSWAGGLCMDIHAYRDLREALE